MKKIIYGIGVMAFIYICAINVNVSLQSEKIASLSFADAMALADGENPGGGENTTTTRIKYSYDPSGNRKSREKVITMSRSSMPNSSAVETDTPDTEVAAAEIPSFEDVLSEMKITIYPNPTQGLLQIDITGGEIPEGAKIYINNMMGMVIRQMNGISGSNTMDISSQQTGTYIMTIMLDKDNISTWKIIKE